MSGNTDEALIREGHAHAASLAFVGTHGTDSGIWFVDLTEDETLHLATVLTRLSTALATAEARADRLAAALQEGIRRLSDEAWMSAGERTRRDYARAALGELPDAELSPHDAQASPDPSPVRSPGEGT